MTAGPTSTLRASDSPPHGGIVASTIGFIPRPFVLVIDDDGQPAEIVAWGMTLPDGSSVVVCWDNGPASAGSVCNSPDSAAWMFGGDVRWLTDSPNTAATTPDRHQIPAVSDGMRLMPVGTP
ncbi:MAG: hypothetical protein JXA67_22325 [Micromonosporaceae bacterium]|nr:hypothetical protein [Micromonosporaceae bacterium]